MFVLQEGEVYVGLGDYCRVIEDFNYVQVLLWKSGNLCYFVELFDYWLCSYEVLGKMVFVLVDLKSMVKVYQVLDWKVQFDIFILMSYQFDIVCKEQENCKLEVDCQLCDE